MDLLQLGIEHVAVAQLRRPEIDQHDLAFERRETHLAAVHVVHDQVGIARLGDARGKGDAGVHAGDLGIERREVGRAGIALLDGFGHRAVVHHVAVAVEKVPVARQPLRKGVHRRQVLLVLHDETQLLAADAVVLLGIGPCRLAPLLLREVRAAESGRDFVQPPRARHVGLVEGAQELRLGRALDRVVADHAADRTELHPVAAREEQRDALAVADDVIERRRGGHVAQLEAIASVLLQHGGVDHRLPQCGHLFEVYAAAVAADEASADPRPVRPAGAQHGRRNDRNAEKYPFVHGSRHY